MEYSIIVLGQGTSRRRRRDHNEFRIQRLCITLCITDHLVHLNDDDGSRGPWTMWRTMHTFKSSMLYIVTTIMISSWCNLMPLRWILG
jgi:hypothetical protein